MTPLLSRTTNVACRLAPSLLAFLVVAAGCSAATENGFPAETNDEIGSGFAVTTNRYSNHRKGSNFQETNLTPANVNKNTFGRQFSLSVDGQAYAQPLFLSNVPMRDGQTHNVLFVSTLHNKVYAFDAAKSAAPIWQRTFGTPGATTEFGCSDMLDTVGITSTPVIDQAAGTLYLVEKLVQGGNWIQHIHALDVTNGNDRPGSPVVITARVAGTGEGSSNGNVSFDPRTALNRAGLMLQNGLVFIAFASHCDKSPYHGWILAYDTSLQQKLAYNVSPNGGKGGIWQSGVGLSSDGTSVFFAAGNGSTSTDGSDLSLSVGRIDIATLKVADFWTPKSFSSLNGADSDLSSGAVLMPHNLLLTGSKDGRIYVLDSTNLGKFHSDSDHIIQTITTQGKSAGERGHVHSTAIHYNVPNVGERIFIWPEESDLAVYRLNADRTLSNPSFSNVGKPGHPGGVLTISANGGTAGTGIVWASVPKTDAWHDTVPGILYAFEAANVGHVLWTSEQMASRDAVGNFAKFNPPLVANGRVYLPTFSNTVQVYGILP